MVAEEGSPGGDGQAGEQAVSLRSIAPSILLPVVVYEVGNGAIAPVVALTALHTGASAGVAGSLVALLGIGQILGNVPAARLADRLGERRCMMVAAAAAVTGLLVCAVSAQLPVLAAGLLLIGAANAAYYLGRQSYLTDVAPLQLRARAMSALSGSHRIGALAGPFAGAGAIAVVGIRGAYLVAAVAATAALIVLVAVRDVRSGDHPGGRVADQGAPSAGNWRQVLTEHRRLLATLGSTVLVMRAVQGSRPTVLPLWAHHLGLDAGDTSIIFGLSSALEVLIFYPAGKVMDRRGRLAVAVPAMLTVAVALLLLPLSHGMIMLAVAAMIFGIGQGLAAGVIFTLAADAAPDEGRSRFLALWRLMTDCGSASGPVAISVIAALTALAPATLAAGVLAVAAAAGLATWVPRYSPFATTGVPTGR